MKILLVHPPQRLGRAQRGLENIMPPLSLLYLASSLKKAGHEVKLLDLYASPLPPEEELAAMTGFKPELAGFATYPGSIDETYRLAKALRAASPGTFQVLGGLYASYLPEIALSQCQADAAVLGEGEATLCELAAAVAEGVPLAKVAGLCYRKHNATFRSAPRSPLLNIDALPWPAYDLLDFDAYRLPPTRAVSRGRVSSVLSARGCNFNCSFCSHHYGYFCHIRRRNPEDVVEEMRHVARMYAVKEFRFEDCAFTADPARAKQICALLKERLPGTAWNCDVRADTASDGLFAAMRAAGCSRVFLGVETGSQKMLGELGANKAIRLDQVRNTVKLAKKHGMRINCSFVLGLPGETLETAMESLKFALELDPDYAMFAALMPVVGSRIFDQAVKEGKIDPVTYRGGHYLASYSNPKDLVTMSTLSAQELVRLMRGFNKEFYGRPGYLLRRLLSVRSLGELKSLADGAAHIFPL
ncbi:MAG: radical SAM protein [Elusimicrobiales bacterium]|nr:radical SAM protein [Elusimicrobiales bacterium]